MKMIPQVPEYYVSRGDLEEQIRSFLIGRPSYSVLQLVGLGGIGKTTLVAKSLYDNKLSSDAYWLSLYEIQDVSSSLREITLEIDNKKSQRRPIIVLDGAEAIESDKLDIYLNHFQDKYLFPKVLITSRQILNRNDSRILALDSFTQEQTSTLLQFWKRSGQQIEELHNLSQGHPLALNLLNSSLDKMDLETIKRNLKFHSEIRNKTDDIATDSKIIQVVRPQIITLRSQIVDRIKKSPQDVYSLSARKYEEFIAELLTDFGWEIELTPQTRDGGKDILATLNTELGKHLCLVETKRYSWDRPIGVSLIRELYGTLMDHQANSSLLVTSSRFSPDAIAFQQKHEYLIGLRDYFDVLDWVSKYKNTAYNKS